MEITAHKVKCEQENQKNFAPAALHFIPSVREDDFYRPARPNYHIKPSAHLIISHLGRGENNCGVCYRRRPTQRLEYRQWRSEGGERMSESPPPSYGCKLQTEAYLDNNLGGAKLLNITGEKMMRTAGAKNFQVL